jgi:hypothetical protein
VKERNDENDLREKEQPTKGWNLPIWESFKGH